MLELSHLASVPRMNKPMGHTLTFDVLHYCSFSHTNKLAMHTILSFVFLHIIYQVYHWWDVSHLLPFLLGI